MNYAIIKTGGKQYKVAPGNVIEIDRLTQNIGDEIKFDSVLLSVAGESVILGTPKVSDVIVKGHVIEHSKGDKIRVSKFKAKARYRRVSGFRAALTRIHIDQVGNTKHEPKKGNESEKVNAEHAVKVEKKEAKKTATKVTAKNKII